MFGHSVRMAKTSWNTATGCLVEVSTARNRFPVGRRMRIVAIGRNWRDIRNDTRRTTNRNAARRTSRTSMVVNQLGKSNYNRAALAMLLHKRPCNPEEQPLPHHSDGQGRLRITAETK